MISKTKELKKTRTRLLVVDDSALTLEIVRRMLADVQEIELVGTARSGMEALELIKKLDPDVICTDFHMPGMDGIALTREVMAWKPKPILVMSASVQADQEENIFRMLQAGAVDILAKPNGGMTMDYGAMSQDLVQKIRILSGVKVMRRSPPSVSQSTPSSNLLSENEMAPAGSTIVGIGSSTGGPQALERILSGLPKDFPMPILCVQHITDGFINGLVGWLASSCKIAVKIAQQGEKPKSGVAYFAPDDLHLELDAGGRLDLTALHPVAGHRPSVDQMFSSIARIHGATGVGVLLTGMGQDGAVGLLRMRRAGAFTIAQDESSSIVFGMPKRAIEMGAVVTVLPLDSIAWRLMQIKGGPKHG